MPLPKDRKISLETKLETIIHWLDPPENKAEGIEREEIQANIQNAANLLAEDINKFLFTKLQEAGVLKPIIENKGGNGG